jgi:Radical SAM superfamily/B12 binding domain
MKRNVLFVQLPIPPAGPSSIIGNIPLAAGYLILYARLNGLEESFDFEILPNNLVDVLSESGLVEQIVARRPWIVGFTCYLWNIDRTLWIAAQLKQRCPGIQIVLGGPEITADNNWVMQSGLADYAIIGEGEQTFTELLKLKSTNSSSTMTTPIVPGLWCAENPQTPLFRKPLADLNVVSSPYLHGILDAGDQHLMLLETIRGCVFKCKFCYYPKSYDALYFVSEEKIVANLRHARQRGATEVVLLDPTLNQRKDFDGFLELLARENYDQQFEYFGELRAEGIKPATAQLLRKANFTEVEIGLQSIDPTAQTMMDRRNNLKAFERGVEAMLEAGLQVKVDLIIGLPGDTVSSVRRGFDYLASSELFSTVQVFNLAILPGTAFRHEAAQLGLIFQDRPPYYVIETPTLKTEHLYELMNEAQDAFQSQWDPFPTPKLNFQRSSTLCELIEIDLELSWSVSAKLAANPAACRAQALTIWIHGSQFRRSQAQLVELVERLLIDNPHTTLQIVLQPAHASSDIPIQLPSQLLQASYNQPNYLDRYYSLNPNGALGSKRVLILLPTGARDTLPEDWLTEVCQAATLAYHGEPIDADALDDFELCLGSQPDLLGTVVDG